jgi:hypothetical protein
MNHRKIFTVVAVIFSLLFLILSSYAADNPQDKDPKLIASGPGFAIHQFEGFVEDEMVESVIRSGIVISHTNLKTGKMKWLVSTGVHSIPTRRISYSISRLVGLLEDERHLIAVVYESGRTFTRTNRPPLGPDPKKGQYILSVFSKAEGENIHTSTFKDSDSFPQSVPHETTLEGVIKKTDRGYLIFDSVFRIDESGEVIREEDSSLQDASADTDKPCR